MNCRTSSFLEPRCWTAAAAGVRQCLLALVPVLLLSAGRCQGVAGAAGQADEPVAAVVNGSAIPVREVEAELRRATNEQPLAPAALAVAQARTLQLLVDRQTILDWLRARGDGASPAEVSLELQRIKHQLASRELPWPRFLAERGLSEARLSEALAWRLSWQRFLSRYRTQENLRGYFEQHRRDFDGTELRVAHILFRVEESAAPEDVARRHRDAEEVRRQLAATELTFAAAARRYSEAPTRERGGDLGWIARHQPMPEVFNRAAFALEEGQISPPVRTRFGVHLILCQEVKPGSKSWQDARSEVEAALARYLFEWAAGQARPRAQVEFTGAVPHFRPGTTELAEGA